MSLEEQVLKIIRPTEEEKERIVETGDRLVEKARALISDIGLDADPIIVGSVAKGTFLKNPDIDIFIRFPVGTPREELEKKGIEIGKRLIPDGRENYAEHPYIHGTYRGFEVDVVPCYRIDDASGKMSAVDRTPFHTEYIKEHLEEWQKDEVRLLKQFMKGIGVYGAEAEIDGFSGYLAELLVLHYGSFDGVLKGSREWRRGTRLFIEHDSPKKFDEPLIFVDPVDSKRNVASALSSDSMALFIYAASEYLKGPDIRFFFPNQREAKSPGRLLDEIEKKATDIIALEMERPDLVPDVLFPQIKKTRRTAAQRLNDAGFRVLNSSYRALSDKIVFLFELEVSSLPSVKKHYGPPVWSDQSENFLKKWSGFGMRIEMGRWVVQIPRESRYAKDYLEKLLPESNMGKDLNEALKKGYRILESTEIAEKYPLILTEMLFPSFPWEI